MTQENTKDTNNVLLPLRRDMLTTIDDFRHAAKMPSRIKTIHKLIKDGLAFNGWGDPVSDQ